MKLHRQFLYRLAAYQVMASMLYAVFIVCQFTFLDYEASKYLWCVAVAYLMQVSSWMKVCLGCWVTFHLFCFAVLLKNMKKLEPLYVISSVLFSVGVSSVPLLTNSYGPSGDWCWIRGSMHGNKNKIITDNDFIERMGVWYGPAFVALVLQLVAMLSMMITVYYRGHRKYDPSGFGCEQNKKAFKQLLPLVSYPLMFVIFFIPPLIYHICDSFGSSTMALRILNAICIPVWSFSAGLTLIVHIGVVQRVGVKFYWLRRCMCCHQKLSRVEMTATSVYSVVTDERASLTHGV